jgi:hypothetical protein
MFCVSGTVTGKYTKHCEKNVHVGNVSMCIKILIQIKFHLYIFSLFT